MTENDRDAIAGRARREYREAKQQLAALQTEARNIGEMLSEVGKLLTQKPESIVFSGQSYDSRFSPGSSRLFEDSHFASATPEKLRHLANEVRQMILKVGRLREDVMRLEGEDPERPAER